MTTRGPVSTKGAEPAQKALGWLGLLRKLWARNRASRVSSFLKTWWLALQLDNDHTWILSEHTIKKRTRKNALDLAGHFFHFVAELFQVCFWIAAIIMLNGDLNIWGLALYVYQNGILSSLLTVLNAALRAEAQGLFQNKLCLKIIVVIALFLITSGGLIIVDLS